MNYTFRLALRYLAGRKLRTFLTTLAIVFGVLLIFGMNTLIPAFVSSFQASAMAIASEVDATISSKTGESFPAATLDRVLAVDGVRAASASLERPINLPQDYFDKDPQTPDRVTAVTLVGAEPDSLRSVSPYLVTEGRFIESGDKDAAVITESLAEAAGVGLGQALTLPTTSGEVNLAVVGILPQRLMPGNEEVLVSLSEAQQLLGMPGVINTIDANFDSVDKARRAEIEANIKSALGSSYTIGVLQPGAEILTNIKTGQLILTLLGSLGLLMGGFIIFNTFRTVIAERRRDIGMLRAVGASRRMVASLILMEGLVQGVLGTAAGLLLGYVFARLVLALIAPIGQQYLNVRVGSPSITPGLVLISIGMGVGITVLAGLLPARSASRITPMEALRPSVGAVSIQQLAGFGFWSGVAMIAVALIALLSGSSALLALGAILFTIGLILVTPALVSPIARLFGGLLALVFARRGTAQLAEGNLSRQPGRAAITASTTMIALAVLVMASSILSSLAISFNTMLQKSLSSDFLLVPPSVITWGTNLGADPGLADQLRAVDGVEVVSTLRFASTQIDGVAVGLLGIEPEAYTQTSGLTFSAGDPQSAYQAMESGRGLVVNGILGSTAGLALGDQVTLLTPTGEVQYTIVGIASDFLNAKTTTGYISQANIEKDFDRNEDVFFQINAQGGADLAAVEAGLKQVIRPYPQFKLVSGAEFLEQNSGLFDAAFAGMYAMMVFLAIPSLIAMLNTLAIGVLERRREIGVLRAVGATRRQVSAVVLGEALILAAIGVAFGLLSGLYLGFLATSALEGLGFPLEYTFPASGVIAGIAVGLIFGALAALIPARHAARLDIVKALAFE